MMKQIYRSEKGVVTIENIKYTLDPETFKPGWFEIIIRDVTRGIPEEKRLGETRVDLKVFDSEAEAAFLAEQAAAAKGKKK